MLMAAVWAFEDVITVHVEVQSKLHISVTFMAVDFLTALAAQFLAPLKHGVRVC